MRPLRSFPSATVPEALLGSIFSVTVGCLLSHLSGRRTVSRPGQHELCGLYDPDCTVLFERGRRTAPGHFRKNMGAHYVGIAMVPPALPGWPPGIITLAAKGGQGRLCGAKGLGTSCLQFGPGGMIAAEPTA